ncbi:MAG TPA: glycosyltransferase family 2 protein [Bacteroidales bacterium]|nr:glycosyltransferase family 2 protein [Bacteroidales bacterium]
MAVVSIITITYNAEKVLEKTMQSVLQQKNGSVEYVIVDGNSKDKTVEIIQRFEKEIAEGKYPAVKSSDFRYISEPDKGLYDAMNKGMQMATGDFVWFINAGDKIFDEHTVEKIENALRLNPSSDVVYGQSLMIGENDQPLGERHKIAPANLKKKHLLRGLVVCHQSILVRKSIAPLYDLQYRISADYDWTAKVLAVSKHNLFIDDYISRFMISGLSAQHRKKSWKERFCIMKKHFGLCRTLWAHFIIIMKYPFTRKYN